MAISEIARKATTFLLAVFLWLHALFFLNIHLNLITKCSHLLRLATSEVVLFLLLFTFSMLAASGFWKTLLSVTYIYFFPFVLLGYVFYWCFLILRAMNRWFKAQANPQLGNALVVEQIPTIAPAVPAEAPPPVAVTPGAKDRFAELLRLLVQPFRRFMFLWCILLLVTTHITVAWLCLIVVLAHLARKIFLIVKILLFSDPWLKKVGPLLLTGLNTALAALAAVTNDAAPTNELKNLWNQLSLWRKILDFLKDPYLLSRWAWVLGIFFFGSVYVYIAVLFSFAYYGIAFVSGVSYSWPDALVASVFIPFFVSELPKIFALKLLGGTHCVLVVAVGIGTVVNFLRRKLDAIRRAATDYSDRFADQGNLEKYLILEQKFSTAATSAPLPKNTGK
jgi:hypothetical protein